MHNKKNSKMLIDNDILYKLLQKEQLPTKNKYIKNLKV